MDHLEVNAETAKTEDDITAELMDAIREANDILFPDSESVTDQADSPRDQAMDSDRVFTAPSISERNTGAKKRVSCGCKRLQETQCFLQQEVKLN
ncbi:hypothetical protein JTB14_019742 [Gonioctena quinquepunctata]|nr:hypothetical protein JTB14_019742 [Gonioctena quinquepunctata]